MDHTRVSRLAGMVVVGSAVLAASCSPAIRSPGIDAVDAARTVATTDRQVVRRAWMELRVRDVDQASQQVETFVAQAGGIIDRASQTKNETVSMELAVPASSLDRFLAELRGVGDVQREIVRSTDVTDEVTDLDARLVNLIAVRDRLRGYLEQAVNLQDIIAIERELTRVQTEIDTVTARLDRLRSEVAMSQVSVTLNRQRVLGPLGLVVAGTAWVVGKLFVIH